jgi:Xaa-Pro dipeptidase
LKQLRMTKDAGEIDSMRRAAKVPERVLAEAITRIKPGMTETQVAGIFMGVSFEQDPQEPASPPLVQTGLSAAFPHAFAGGRVVQAGDLMVVDFGAVVNSYGSDITRTIAIGAEPGEEMRHVYEVVKQANAAGRAAVRPGILAEDVDAAARDVIERAGYGRYFTHRTGHGLGLEGHEAPYMVKGDRTVLQPGMTFTVEPGIYIEGKGGVRIEDDMVVTPEGGESLTNFTRDLIIAR